MQGSVPKGVGGMVAVLGSEIEVIENLINENKNKYECYIANDNSSRSNSVKWKYRRFRKNDD